jgi:hypothetical protein
VIRARDWTSIGEVRIIVLNYFVIDLIADVGARVIIVLQCTLQVHRVNLMGCIIVAVGMYICGVFFYRSTEPSYVFQ